MSSKVIEFADFSYMCRLGLYKACAKNCSEEICEEWKLYKTPSFVEVCGKRELKDMTEEEFEELLKIAGLDCKYVESNDNHNPASIFKKYNVECRYNTLYTSYWTQNIDDWDETELEIEPGTVWMHGNYCNPIQVTRWFIKHGFNVFGEGK